MQARNSPTTKSPKLMTGCPTGPCKTENFTAKRVQDSFTLSAHDALALIAESMNHHPECSTYE